MTTVLALSPPLPQPSISTTDSEDLFFRLNDITVVEEAIQNLFDQHDSLSFEEISSEFDIIIYNMTRWLETAHLVAFTLEQNVKQDNDGIKQIVPLEVACARMEPIIYRLADIGEIIDDREDIESVEQRQSQFKAKISLTKIQSEWSGLQHFISSVKKSIEDCNEKNTLRSLMESILVQIDDLSLMIFQFQEKKHITAAFPSASVSTSTDDNANNLHLEPFIRTSHSSSSTTISLEERPKEDKILIEIDNRVGPLFNDVEKVYTRMTSPNPPDDTTGLLARKHLLVQEKWECLRVEIDELKFELKEDRWLIVFRQVADQVDGMMDGLDKTVSQCYTMLQQLREYPGNKAMLRTPHSNSSSSTSSTATSPAQPQLFPNGPVDLAKFRSVEKNFEAKYKYYTPSIAKMLMMLGNGIAARVSRNTLTIQRHEAMLHRWNQLKATMDHLRKRDLPEIEKTMFDRPISPAWSRLSDVSDKSQNSFKDARFRSPEPPQPQMDMLMMMDNRSGTPGNRSRSPYAKSLHNNGLPNVHSPTFSSPYEDGKRGRSATPNSNNGRDGNLWRSMNQNGSNSPSPVNGRSPSQQQQQQQQQQHQQRTISPLSYARDTYPLLSSGLRPSMSDSSSVSSSPSLTRTNYSLNGTNTSNNIHAARQGMMSPTLYHNNHSSNSSMRLSPVNNPEYTKMEETKSWMQPTKSTLIRNSNSNSNMNDNNSSNNSVQSVDNNNNVHNTHNHPNVHNNNINNNYHNYNNYKQYHEGLYEFDEDDTISTEDFRVKPTHPANHGRSKTPNTGFERNNMISVPYRPKSSMTSRQQQTGQLGDKYVRLPHQRPESKQASRTMTPSDRRCRTPSLIPRPKTPNDNFLTRSASPSMLPRPRSSMARTNNTHNNANGVINNRSLQVVSSHESEEDEYHSNSSFLNDSHPPLPRSRTLRKQISSPSLGYNRRQEGQEGVKIAFEEPKKYRPDPKDPLDMEIGNIVNASPITIKCQKAPQGNGRYYFGNELTPSLGGGKKIYTCKLMNYDQRNRGSPLKRNKVLIRVGGGWQDLEIFLLEHMNLMGSDIVVRSFVHNPLKR
ncbi:hypothetical protein BDB01DRAFT_798116 [Pilobolus umbonatus]|nr:hypothetical protein BDB01DRAFT_798116 [Pilobolus umbonatus]